MKATLSLTKPKFPELPKLRAINKTQKTNFVRYLILDDLKKGHFLRAFKVYWAMKKKRD